MNGYPHSNELRSASRRRFLQLTAATGALGVVPTSRSARARSTPNVQTIFSYPTGGSADNRHEESFTRLLSQATPGSEVYFTVYIFTRENIADAIVAAADRGVDLNVLIDERSENSQATGILRQGLDDDSLGIVSNAGVGNRINHNKFMILEELDTGDRNVVWQSSSNFTNNQIYYHNSSVIIRDDRTLYDVYRSYWEDLADESFTDLSYNRTEQTDTATVYFSPRDDYDPYLKVLENVVPTWRTRIYFLQSIWTESREAATDLIQGRLTELVEEGADVRAVVQERDNSIPDRLEEAGVEVVVYPEEAGTQVHTKNMLVESEFETENGDTERRKEVLTGTQNLSRPGLRRNDETMLRIVDDYVYNDFLDDWERVHQQAQRIRARLDDDGGTPSGSGDPTDTPSTATPTDTPSATTPTDTPSATTPTDASSAATLTETTPTATERSGQETTVTTAGSESGPGFGVVASAASVLAAAGYAAYRGSAGETDE